MKNAWRIVILLGMALGFAVTGLIVIVAGIIYGLKAGNSDDILAALFMGGLLLLAGIMLAVLAWQVYQKTPKAMDTETALALGLAHLMSMRDHTPGNAAAEDGNTGEAGRD